MANDWQATAYFSSFDDMKESLEAFVNSICSNVCLCDDKRFDLRLIISELSMNALTHGDSPVTIKACECYDGEVHILISHDEKDGFDPSAYFEKLPDVESDSGRGIFIVKHLSDGVAYSKCADKVLVRFNCGRTQ